MRWYGIVLLLSLIILFSGCVNFSMGPPPEEKPFVNNFNRVADSEEGYRVIDFVEKVDVFNFLNITANDTRITECKRVNSSIRSARFIRNIAKMLKNTEEHFSFYYQGFLNYSIVAKFLSITHYSELITHAKNMLDKLSLLIFPETIGIAGYVPKAPEKIGTMVEELSMENNVLNILGKTNLTDNLWLVTVFIHAWGLDAGAREGQWDVDYYQVEILLLDPMMNFLGIFSTTKFSSYLYYWMNCSKILVNL